MEVANTTTVAQPATEIKYDRITRDWAAFVGGEYVGSRASRREAVDLADSIATDHAALGCADTEASAPTLDTVSSDTAIDDRIETLIDGVYYDRVGGDFDVFVARAWVASFPTRRAADACYADAAAPTEQPPLSSARRTIDASTLMRVNRALVSGLLCDWARDYRAAAANVATTDKAAARHWRAQATAAGNAAYEAAAGTWPMAAGDALVLASRRTEGPAHVISCDGDWVCTCAAGGNPHWALSLIAAIDAALDMAAADAGSEAIFA